MGGISIWQLIILLVIVVLVFGTKRLRNMGGDLGAAIKGFRKGMEDEKSDSDAGEPEQLGEEASPSPQAHAESKAKADAEFRKKEEELSETGDSKAS
ncbi:MAG: Sec-independent protein translocase subunit TatA [Xanthomonadales bacterium]|nr:Sec-independent protein translocase subunit TatA [Xanthomonadales bacterium]